MILDLVFPNNNEKEFIQSSKELGYDGVIFVYKNKLPEKQIKEKNIFYVKEGYIANPQRKDFETKKTRLVYDMELSKKSDFIHHRNSGLNHVLINLAKEKNILIGFNFNNILTVKGRIRANLVGRQKQNLKLSQKTNIAIFSGAKKPIEQRPIKQIKNFYQTLGASSQQLKQAFETLAKQQKHI